MSTAVRPATLAVAGERLRGGDELEVRSPCGGDVGFVPSAGAGCESR